MINLSLFTHPNVVPDPYVVIFSVQFKRRNFLKNRFSPIISVVPYTKLSYEFTKHMNNFYNTFLLFSFGPGHYESLLYGNSCKYCSKMRVSKQQFKFFAQLSLKTLVDVCLYAGMNHQIANRIKDLQSHTYVT